MKNTVSKIVLLISIITITSCNKKQEVVSQEEVIASNPEKVLQYIKDLGFPESSIVDKGIAYFVEGDIMFLKTMEVPAKTDGAKTEQYYSGNTVSAINKLNVRVFVDPSMTSMLAEINSALLQWNSVAGSTLRFNIVTAEPYDILIADGDLGDYNCGGSLLPSDGKAGSLILINKNYIAGNSFEQRARTICHEFGHTISLVHTNWASIGEPGGPSVPGVDGTDAASLMNGGECNVGATVLSDKDKAAIAALY